MSKLDAFSRLEKGVFQVLIYFSICGGAPIGAIWVADFFFLKTLSPVFRYLLWAVIAVVGFGISLRIAEGVQSLFTKLRRIFGMKPLTELEAEIEEERETKEKEREERRRQRFMDCSDAEQRYTLWVLEQHQVENLKAIRTSLDTIKLLLIGLLVYFLLTTIF